MKLLFILMFMISCGEFPIEQAKPRKSPAPVPGPQGEPGVEGKTGPAGKDGQNGIDGADAEPCSVVQHSDGATISCPDGTVAEIYHGTDGQDGEDGQDGQNGIDGQDGIDGKDGQDGADGIDGQDGIDNTLPLYVGYYCSRTVLKIGGIHYVVHNALVPLNSAWYRISNSCEMRLKNNKIETRDP